MTLVEHLDELRSRIIVSVIVLAVACGLCFWQNHLLLDIANEPLPDGRVPITFGVTTPFLLLIPVLFIGGVVFAYFVVVPAAAQFLLNFNEGQFNIEVRASEYYGFLITTLMAVGLVFQVPVGIVAVTRLGITTPAQLAKNRRYAYLILAVVAMLLPGTDPVTMLIELTPLLLLFEFSLVLARIVS